LDRYHKKECVHRIVEKEHEEGRRIRSVAVWMIGRRVQKDEVLCFSSFACKTRFVLSCVGVCL